MRDYSNKKALIIGLARSGLAAARLLDRLGASIAVTDMKPESELGEYAAKLPDNTLKFLGGHDDVAVNDYSLAVISPGVPWDSPLAAAVRGAGIELVSEAELAFTRIDAPVIAITGSNGKSTTTALIGEILKASGAKVYVGGNIGAPLSDAAGGDYDWVVAEMSSFQLEGIKTFRPKIGLVLNISPDHLDRHRDMDTYVELKARLFMNQDKGDVLILNADDRLVMDIGRRLKPALHKFSRAPFYGCGAWVEGGMAVAKIDDERIELFKTAGLSIKGEHNIENALAASLAGLAADVDAETIKSAVCGFTGLAHRMELVDEICGVSYYNDSKGTNVDATCKSLLGFCKNVALIAGGSSKGGDYKPLADAVFKRAKAVVLIGETAGEIETALGQFQPKVKANDMYEAVETATKWLEQGDSVLLSPGCASFDMFDSFEHRGDVFKSAVAKLKEAS